MFFPYFYQITLKAGLNIDHFLEPFLFVLSVNIRKWTLNYLVGGNRWPCLLPESSTSMLNISLVPILCHILGYLSGETGDVRAATGDIYQRVFWLSVKETS